MSVKTIVERCEALFEDLRFGAVRDWKAAAPGGIRYDSPSSRYGITVSGGNPYFAIAA